MSIVLDQDLLTTALDKVAALRSDKEEGSIAASDLAQNDNFMALVDTCNRKWEGLSSAATAVHLGMIVGFEYARLLQAREVLEGR